MIACVWRAVSWLLAHGLAPSMRKGYAGAPPLNKVHRESAKGKLLRVPHGQVSKGAGRPAASSSERDHVSKRAAEASNVALAVLRLLEQPFATVLLSFLTSQSSSHFQCLRGMLSDHE